MTLTYVISLCTYQYVEVLWFSSQNLNPCPAEYIKRPLLLLIFSQSDYLIQIIDINSHTSWQTVQIQISWLLQKPTDLDLDCLQRKGISGFSRTRVKGPSVMLVISLDSGQTTLKCRLIYPMLVTYELA